MPDTLDSDLDDKIGFKDFADLFEPTIQSYENKGLLMEVGSRHTLICLLSNQEDTSCVQSIT